MSFVSYLYSLVNQYTFAVNLLTYCLVRDYHPVYFFQSVFAFMSYTQFPSDYIADKLKCFIVAVSDLNIRTQMKTLSVNLLPKLNKV